MNTVKESNLVIQLKKNSVQEKENFSFNLKTFSMSLAPVQELIKDEKTAKAKPQRWNSSGIFPMQEREIKDG